MKKTKTKPKISYRLMKRSELLSAVRILIRSYNNFLRKTGRKPQVKPSQIKEASSYVNHLYTTDPKGCFGAYLDGRMVGFGHALMRGKQWYLANLFVEPSKQLSGVGRELLKRIIKYANGKADSYSLCTFCNNETALGIYSSFGFMPLDTIFEFILKPRGKKINFIDTGLKKVEVITYKSLLRINKLEKEIRGYARLVDLNFFLEDKTYKVFDFYKGKKWVGYSVVKSNLELAPAGAVEPKYLPLILAETVKDCVENKAKFIRIWAGTENEAVFRQLKSYGFRIREMNAFLGTKKYADMQRYIPASLAQF